MSGLTTPYRCSFCGKTQEEVRRLVEGASAYICDECVPLCVERLADLDPGPVQISPVARATLRLQALPVAREVAGEEDPYVVAERLVNWSLGETAAPPAKKPTAWI